MIRRYFLPRPLHPYVWWLWAIGLAVMASGTTNPLLLAGIIAVVCLVTVSRCGDNPWAKGFKLYLILGAFIVLLRVAFRIVFGGGDGPTVLLHLPTVPLPSWVAGIRLLGPVSLESLLYGLYDGLRLATMIICLGAANSLVNPKRLLAALPAAMYELGTILVVSFSVFPQLGESLVRVMRVRRLRGGQTTPKSRRRRLGVVETIIVPVLSDALDRSIALAASMEVRGYGRGGQASGAERAASTLLGMGGIIVLSVWSYFLLAQPGIGPHLGRVNVLEVGLLIMGVAGIVVAMGIIGRHVQRTRYRRDRWRLPETVVLVCGLLPAYLVHLVANGPDPSVLDPSIPQHQWPVVTGPLALALLIGALPAFLTPPPVLSTSTNNEEGLS